MSKNIPKTIEELKKWYEDNSLPSENVTRFYIGKNYTRPRAFGIYQDKKTENFIVYKNKANGTRSIRYEGPNEEYAVKELYLKLTEEIINQKARNANNSKYSKYAMNKKITILICVLAFVFFFGIPILDSFLNPKQGYYKYNNSYYYHQGSDWYSYNDYYGWKTTNVPEELRKKHSNYYKSSYYNSYGIARFEDSTYYIEPSTSSSDSDDYNWDSGSSWDSDFTDWDSDW